MDRIERVREMEGRLNRLCAWLEELPAELPRGVLSEDGIYNALERLRELPDALRGGTFPQSGKGRE